MLGVLCGGNRANALRIKMQNHTTSRRMRLWWQTNNRTPAWEEKNTVAFDVNPEENDDTVYTVGSTASDYYAGANLPSEVFAEYLAANDQNVDISSLVNYVTVDTKGEAPSLNLRQSPSTDSAVLAEVP